MLGKLFLNGQYVFPEQASISALDRGFLFGESIYEVWLVVRRRLVDMQSHLDRLDRSLKESGIPAPPERANLASILQELVVSNSLVNGSLYLQITSGSGERSFTGNATSRPTLLVMAQNKNYAEAPTQETGISVDLVMDPRWIRRDIKTTMLLPQVMAKKSAIEHGYNDAIFYDQHGVTEGASSNVFIVTSKGELITRPLSHSLLPGCTRERVLSLARSSGLKVQEQVITLDQLFTAQEVFVTSATYLVTPVVSINGHHIANGQKGPITQQLQIHYSNYIESLPVC